MSEHAPKMSLRDRFRWWLYERCFAYCVRCVHPNADPSEFTLLDIANFSAISKDELRAIAEEAPEIAWHFAPEFVEEHEND